MGSMGIARQAVQIFETIRCFFRKRYKKLQGGRFAHQLEKIWPPNL